MAKKISAKDLVNDIRSGMDDDGLMRKYEISDQGLRRLLGQLLEKGLITESDLSSRPPKATEAVVDTNLSRQETSEPSSPEGTPERSKSEDITFQNLFGGWYESKKALILLLIFATPIGLYGLHKTSLWSKKTKIGIAVLTVILAIAAIKPALRLWVMGVVGIGAYALYKLLPFGRAARIAISVVAGMMVVGMIFSVIDKDSVKSGTVPAQPTAVTEPAPQPVQPKPAPVVQPAQPKSDPAVQAVSCKDKCVHEHNARAKRMTEEYLKGRTDAPSGSQLADEFNRCIQKCAEKETAQSVVSTPQAAAVASGGVRPDARTAKDCAKRCDDKAMSEDDPVSAYEKCITKCPESVQLNYKCIRGCSDKCGRMKDLHRRSGEDWDSFQARVKQAGKEIPECLNKCAADCNRLHYGE